MRAVLILAFPVLAHLAVVYASPELELLALAVLVAALFPGPLRRREPLAIGAWVAVSLAAAAAIYAGAGRCALALPSLAVPAAIGALFATSLLPGRTPLVSRYAAVLHGGSLPPSLQAYTRAVTVLWATSSLALMLTNFALLLFGSPTRWSAFANGYSYAILGAVFVLEYAYRRWHFRHLPQPGLAAYLKLLSSQPPGSV